MLIAVQTHLEPKLLGAPDSLPDFQPVHSRQLSVLSTPELTGTRATKANLSRSFIWNILRADKHAVPVLRMSRTPILWGRNYFHSLLQFSLIFNISKITFKKKSRCYSGNRVLKGSYSHRAEGKAMQPFSALSGCKKQSESVAHINIYIFFFKALNSLSDILGKHLFWFLKVL